jgi:hypothetical protein
MKKEYLKHTFNPRLEIYEVELMDMNGKVIRSYAEVGRKEDAEFVCSSFNSRPELEQTALELHQMLQKVVTGFRDIKTGYSEYQKTIEQAKELLGRITD